MFRIAAKSHGLEKFPQFLTVRIRSKVTLCTRLKVDVQEGFLQNMPLSMKTNVSMQTKWLDQHKVCLFSRKITFYGSSPQCHWQVIYQVESKPVRSNQDHVDC